MAFKKKSTRVVGTNHWKVEIPTPPRHATHVRMTCFDHTYDNGKPKTATVPIEDFGVLRGTEGKFVYVRMNNALKLIEEYEDAWDWNGKEVVGIESMREQ